MCFCAYLTRISGDTVPSSAQLLMKMCSFVFLMLWQPGASGPRGGRSASASTVGYLRHPRGEAARRGAPRADTGGVAAARAGRRQVNHHFR
jgi:hypothetical protein